MAQMKFKAQIDLESTLRQYSKETREGIEKKLAQKHSIWESIGDFLLLLGIALGLACIVPIAIVCIGLDGLK